VWNNKFNADSIT